MVLAGVFLQVGDQKVRWGTKKYVTQICVEKPFRRSQDLEPVGSPGLVRVLVKELRGGTGTPATGQDRTLALGQKEVRRRLR